jgi:hypothetical protein
MENGKNIRWIVRNDVKESNRETIELVGSRKLLRIYNRVIWYYYYCIYKVCKQFDRSIYIRNYHKVRKTTTQMRLKPIIKYTYKGNLILNPPKPYVKV